MGFDEHDSFIILFVVDGKGLFKDGGTGLWSYDRDPSPLSLN